MIFKNIKNASRKITTTSTFQNTYLLIFKDWNICTNVVNARGSYRNGTIKININCKLIRKRIIQLLTKHDVYF